MVQLIDYRFNERKHGLLMRGTAITEKRQRVPEVFPERMHPPLLSFFLYLLLAFFVLPLSRSQFSIDSFSSSSCPSFPFLPLTPLFAVIKYFSSMDGSSSSPRACLTESGQD
mmetsp:Transcript_19633/g.39512  ORF Transcript_19633/g.39512 Transcript_19633/m.39512 type:complete len:112 (-) Transcript_19633:625-960(-)